MNGYIKLHRKMVEWGWYSDCVVKDVFIHLLMVAQYKPTQYLGYELHAGDVIVGRKKMAEELGFSEQQIRTALKKLESTGEITKKSTNKFSIVTVVNWAFYQCDDEDSNQQVTNKQPTNNQQVTNEQPTNNHLQERKNIRNKESKNTRNIKEIYKEMPEALKTVLDDFVSYRSEIKKPITETGMKQLLTKLNKLSGGDVNTCVDILNQSMANGWQGIFPLKEEKAKSNINAEMEAWAND